MLLLIVFLVWTPAAYAWGWPVQGPVLQPFSYDPAHPYTAGQHRGVDIGAVSSGETVVAPAAGTVSFAGTVAANGESVTIQTPDGYSVTLTHLGSILVAKGSAVEEQQAIGTIGPSGTAEVTGPYVHLGIRVTADPNGYLDPLTFLPPAETGSGSEGSNPAQPASGSGSSTATGGSSGSHAGSSFTTSHQPARPQKESSSQASGSQERSRAGNEDARTQASRSDARPDRLSRRAATPHGEAAHCVRPAATQRRADAPTRFLRRPVVEPAASGEPIRLDAGHESRGHTPIGLLPPILNGTAALVAWAAVLAAARERRRRRVGVSPLPGTPVVQLPPRSGQRRAAARAA